MWIRNDERTRTFGAVLRTMVQLCYDRGNRTLGSTCTGTCHMQRELHIGRDSGLGLRISVPPATNTAGFRALIVQSHHTNSFFPCEDSQ